MSHMNYYATGNTAEGFINFLNSNLQGIERVFVLNHESNKVKTKMLNRLINIFKDTEMELLLSPLGERYLDGLIIREKSLAVISDRALPQGIKNVISIDLTGYIPNNSDPEMEKSKKTFDSLIQDAYDQFAKGLEIHDHLESIYINEMDFDRADEVANQFIEGFFSGITKEKDVALVYRRLFGTNTPNGAVNIVPELLSSMKHAYFIKGRAGTGKSTFMKKVLAVCKDLGYDIELYHCSFDPKSIDMVLVRELSFCIFDSTDPHEFFPQQKEHQVIDMYAETVTPGTDEKYAEKIDSVTSHYKSHMKRGISLLKEADQYLDKIEANYNQTVEVEDDILNHVLNRLS